MLTLSRLRREIDSNGPLRSLSPEFIQRLYRGLRTVRLKEDRSSPAAFVLCLESWLAQGAFDQVIAAPADETDLRIQDVKFRAQHYRTHGVPAIADMGFELRGFTCGTSFQRLDVLPNGGCHLCCAVWQRQPVGNLFHQSPGEVWNSRSAQDIRQGIADGSFRYCGKQLCGMIAGRQLPVQNQQPIANVGPTVLNLSYDRTCNLSCPTCRTEKVIETGAHRDYLDQMTNDRIIPLLKTKR